MSSASERIEASVIDGRALTPRFKQRQLTALHKTLQSNEEAIRSAIEKDSSYTTLEAQVTFYLTIDAIKHFYEALDFNKLLSDEYNLAHSKDNPDRRTAIGYVHIVPNSSNLLYSTIVPLAAAISAGNCALVEIKQTTSMLGALLSKVLTASLDRDTFGVVDKEVMDENFKKQYCRHLDCSQNHSKNTVAVVDRSADLSRAAQELVRARMSFGGKACYAPDLVLVNEYCVEEFCKAAVQSVVPYLSQRAQGRSKSNGHVKSPGSTDARKDRSSVLKKAETDSSVTILSAGDAASVALVKDRQHDLLTTGIDDPLLLIHPISSLDDAIDLANTTSRNSLQALYLFSAPPAAKYLSQFISADITLVNHVPVSLLVGPTVPKFSDEQIGYFKTQIHPRFTSEMFSRPCPEFTSQSGSSSASVDQLANVWSDGRQNDAARLSTVVKLTQGAQLKPIDEPQGGAIGFFEQGLITGGSIFLSTLVIGSVTAVKYGYPYLMRLIRKH